MEQLSKNLSKNAVENIMKWLKEPKYAEFKSDLESMLQAGDWALLEDSFFKEIEFGTGGRRGVTGVGSNRINKITIGESTQALCQYALSFDEKAKEKGIVIAYDTRLTSAELSRVAAEVSAANGFKTFIFDGFRATPELSFAVRHLGCVAGIVISASHNPPTDNGFKAYWSDGGQLVSPHDKGVMDTAKDIVEIITTNFDEAVLAKKIIIIGDDVDQAYYGAVLSEAEGEERDLSIVYSPLHGTGQASVLPVLQMAGFNNISIVESQMTPDGNFPTIPNGKPNPEEKPANDMAVAQMMKEQADLAITNDPDADRIGVIVRDGDKSVYLNGNQTAVLATEYALKRLKEKGKLTPKHYIAKTIVTTDMLNAIAEHYGVKVYDNLLIGFKYIGELIRLKENDENFVIGGEESYGLLKGTYARDKDAAVGALLLAEFAAELKKSGSNLYERLLDFYKRYGLFVERLDTMVCPGAAGFEQMNKIMTFLRKSAPKRVAEHQVTAVLDYDALTRLDIVSGKTTPIECKSGNVIVLEFGDRKRRITIRPSGTEPKLKFYIQWFEEYNNKAIKKQHQDIELELANIAKKLETTLLDI